MTLVKTQPEAATFHRIHERNDDFHAVLCGLCHNDFRVPLIRNYIDLTYAIRGAAFANPENLNKSREHHRMTLRLLSGTGLLGARADLRGPHTDAEEQCLSALSEGRLNPAPQLSFKT